MSGAGETMTGVTEPRDRTDRCPGVLRPWIADDGGALVRLRLVGGRTTIPQLRELAEIARIYSDSFLALTRRANLQIRGLDHDDGRLRPDLVAAVEATGLLPSPSHELVRNIMVSPMSGILGGRADLQPAAARYDELLRADPELADLSGRFLVVLDDGRGDVLGRSLDLGAVAVDAEHAQLRAGESWGEVVPIDELPEALITLAHRFRRLRGDQVGIWHVAELPDDGAEVLPVHHARDLRTQVTSLPLRLSRLAQPDGREVLHTPTSGGELTEEDLYHLAEEGAHDVVVTPWRSLVLPDLEAR